jgi:hypothetical protein
MSLTETTSQELQKLAKEMLSTEQDVSTYGKFGVLVKANTSEFERRKEVVVFGEVEVDRIKFIYFAS